MNSSAKFRAVEELVKVTTSAVPRGQRVAQGRPARPTRRVVYAATSVTTAPSRGQLPDEDVARLRRARQEHAVSAGQLRAQSLHQPLARYSRGTISTRSPCSTIASAVAGPMAATRARAKPDHARRRVVRRRSTMITPLTLVKISQVKLSAASRAASRGAHEAGGSMAMVGVSSTLAPALGE